MAVDLEAVGERLDRALQHDTTATCVILIAGAPIDEILASFGIAEGQRPQNYLELADEHPWVAIFEYTSGFVTPVGGGHGPFGRSWETRLISPSGPVILSGDGGVVTWFACVRCGERLTAELTEVPLPAFVVDDSEEEIPPPLMTRGTYAIDPQPFGPPHVPITPGLARLHGIDESGGFAWQRVPRENVRVSAGPIGTVVVHPEDTVSLRRTADQRRLNGCCNLDGLDGPNLVCASCGLDVATLKNDCYVGRTTLRLEPSATRAVS